MQCLLRKLCFQRENYASLFHGIEHITVAEKKSNFLQMSAIAHAMESGRVRQAAQSDVKEWLALATLGWIDGLIFLRSDS